MKPVRIQRKRTKGWRMPANTVSVTRPGPLGNPFGFWRNDKTGESGPEFEVLLFRRWLSGEMHGAELYERLAGHKNHALAIATINRLDERRQGVLDRLSSLRGKNLACWCAADQPCHAAVLLEIANAESDL